MTPERWKQIEKLYHEALKLEPSHRAAYLQESCQDDEELRHEVESLLAADAQAESFIESPALEMAAQPPVFKCFSTRSEVLRRD